MIDADAVTLVRVDERSRDNAKRIEKLEKNHEAIHELATAVKVMANEQKNQTGQMREIQDSVRDLDVKVDTLEKKPGKRWEAFVLAAIGAVASGLIGFAVAQLGG